MSVNKTLLQSLSYEGIESLFARRKSYRDQVFLFGENVSLVLLFIGVQ